MKAALQNHSGADLLTLASLVLPAAALSVSQFLDQSMRRPSLAGMALHSLRLVM